jgi:hypothetical protein
LPAFSGFLEFTEKWVFVPPEFRYERCGGQGISAGTDFPGRPEHPLPKNAQKSAKNLMDS